VTSDNTRQSAAGSIQVRILADDDPVWTEIDNRPDLSIYHTRDWAILVREVFGHVPKPVAVFVDGELIELLPAFLVRNPLLGAKLISTPYEGCYGGFSSADAAVQTASVETLLRIAGNARASILQIRTQRRIEILEDLGFVSQQPLLVTDLKLIDEETNWGQLTAKHRRNVRAATKKGVSVETANSLEEMQIFFAILSRHYKDLGLPFFSFRYFEKIWKYLVEKGRADLLIARIDGTIIGGHLLFFSGEVLLSKYSAYIKNSEFKSTYASYTLFWEAIRIGINRGLRSFNLGVTGRQNRGLLDFKNRFGATTAPISFYTHQFRGKLPDFSEYYGGYRTLKKIWSLSPRFLTTPIGQLINTWLC
jgi:hypothetical protein